MKTSWTKCEDVKHKYIGFGPNSYISIFKLAFVVVVVVVVVFRATIIMD